jgi:hypothetical protein
MGVKESYLNNRNLLEIQREKYRGRFVGEEYVRLIRPSPSLPVRIAATYLRVIKLAGEYVRMVLQRII